jgi:DNA invertase Pin-like site-specific DNA recombinase
MTAREKNSGLIYLRRSSGRQEASLDNQLDWALQAAQKLGVNIDASKEDLAEAIRLRASKYKSLRLDDSISGRSMDRPGFLSLLEDAKRDCSISHVFVWQRDRLARPEDAMSMAVRDRQMREKGVTLVCHNRIWGPRQQGVADLADDMATYLEYYQSGES